MPASQPVKQSIEDAETPQTLLKRELVEIFSDLAELLGNPRSLGEIYGLLFASEHALSMEEIVVDLHISKGSASQGLRQLEELGAVTRAKADGTRNHLYSARLELKPLLAGFLSKRLGPGLSGGAERLGRLHGLIPELPRELQPAARLRLDRITKWHKRAATFIPLAQRLLQGE